MDILRNGIESIDSFDAKSYEYRIERAQAFDRKSIDSVERVRGDARMERDGPARKESSSCVPRWSVHDDMSQ
jgi:hypothetical protein